MKRLTILCIGALLSLSAASDAFGWGAVTGPRGGAAYRGPMGGAAVRGPYGGAAVRGPYGGAAVRGPYGGTAVRGPVYGGGTVERGRDQRTFRIAGARRLTSPVGRRPVT